MKFKCDVGRLPGFLASVVKNDTRRPGSSTGSGFNNVALMTLKTAVLAPMPSARESAATRVKAGLLNKILNPKRMSCHRVSIRISPLFVNNLLHTHCSVEARRRHVCLFSGQSESQPNYRVDTMILSSREA